MASISDTNQMRIRRALGYMGMSETQAISFGYVVNAEYLYLINARMAGDAHDEHFVALLIEELTRVEETDRQLFDAQGRLKARSVGNIHTNPEEIERLEAARRRWAERLAQLLGVPFYPNPFRQGGCGLNMRVNHA